MLTRCPRPRADDRVRPAEPELRNRALDVMLANGLLLLGCGSRSVRFRPPLNLSAAEADAGPEIVRRSLKEL